MAQKGMTKEERIWAEQQKQVSDAGLDVSEKAAIDALDYVERVSKNFDKTEHRKSVMSKHALEVGIAMHLRHNVMEQLMPTLQLDIETEKGKATALLITSLFLARYMRNIMEEVNEYEGK